MTSTLPLGEVGGDDRLRVEAEGEHAEHPADAAMGRGGGGWPITTPAGAFSLHRS